MPTEPAPSAAAGADVFAVLAAHDGARWLPEALAALAASTVRPGRVVAVDTGSTDGSADLLRAALGDDAVLILPRTAGWPDAVAAALAAADAAADASPRARFLWLLHDDAAPDPTCLARLLEEAARQPSAALLGPKAVDWDDPRVLVEVGVTTDRAGTRTTGLEQREQDQGQHDAVRDVLAVGTAGLLARRERYDAVGGLDPLLPLFRDELDLGWRTTAAASRVLVVPAARVRHARAATTGQRTPGAVRAPAVRVDRRHALLVLLAHASVALAAPSRVDVPGGRTVSVPVGALLPAGTTGRAAADAGPGREPRARRAGRRGPAAGGPAARRHRPLALAAHGPAPARRARPRRGRGRLSASALRVDDVRVEAEQPRDDVDHDVVHELGQLRPAACPRLQGAAVDDDHRRPRPAARVDPAGQQPAERHRPAGRLVDDDVRVGGRRACLRGDRRHVDDRPGDPVELVRPALLEPLAGSGDEVVEPARRRPGRGQRHDRAPHVDAPPQQRTLQAASVPVAAGAAHGGEPRTGPTAAGRAGRRARHSRRPARRAGPTALGRLPSTAVSPVRRCSRTACAAPAVATLTYVYADSTAVVGPLATYAEPHTYDLCEAHASRLTAPRGWEVVRHEAEHPDVVAARSADDLVALADAVREAARPARPAGPAPEPGTGRRGHLRAVPSRS
jgi:GT2 family glycosyltransferase